MDHCGINDVRNTGNQFSEKGHLQLEADAPTMHDKVAMQSVSKVSFYIQLSRPRPLFSTKALLFVAPRASADFDPATDFRKIMREERETSLCLVSGLGRLIAK